MVHTRGSLCAADSAGGSGHRSLQASDSAERQRAVRKPPHIVVTTPESLYILLGSDSGRAMLATTRTVIVDEIHALAPNKRGPHLAVSLPDPPGAGRAARRRRGARARGAHFLASARARGRLVAAVA